MSDNGGSGVNALAIVAIVILVGIAGLWFYNTQYRHTPMHTQTKNVNVKVEVPVRAPAPAPAPAPATK